MISRGAIIRSLNPPWPPSWQGSLIPSWDETHLGSDLNTAYIPVIPKPGKDASDVSIYRPISLINNDLKIMPKILAMRFSSVIAKYIH